ncbi:hypothetical protein [Mesorhizobium sp. M9A.F.Ca.ET.002.03.1.2]|uniref:hypothetical protein n=1 Tax=Mesorhizobium sp. M9A.F.Ca.ET.002.03.1.2 TaxID=2493668 RepID=UPI001FDFA06B|nr:hypothetical protein [Mesorhizobium sp. M9A.F.Ca.ET.002.03.1.2]
MIAGTSPPALLKPSFSKEGAQRVVWQAGKAQAVQCGVALRRCGDEWLRTKQMMADEGQNGIATIVTHL